MTPADIPWWTWFVMAAAVWGFSAILGLTAKDEDEDGCLGMLFHWGCNIAGLLCAVIGLIRFVKWVWVS